MQDLTRESRFWNLEWAWKPSRLPTIKELTDEVRVAVAALNRETQGTAACYGPDSIDDCVVLRFHLGPGHVPGVVVGRLRGKTGKCITPDFRFHELRPEDRKLPYREAQGETATTSDGTAAPIPAGPVGEPGLVPMPPGSTSPSCVVTDPRAGWQTYESGYQSRPGANGATEWFKAEPTGFRPCAPPTDAELHLRGVPLSPIPLGESLKVDPPFAPGPMVADTTPASVTVETAPPPNPPTAAMSCEGMTMVTQSTEIGVPLGEYESQVVAAGATPSVPTTSDGVAIARDLPVLVPVDGQKPAPGIIILQPGGRLFGKDGRVKVRLDDSGMELYDPATLTAAKE